MDFKIAYVLSDAPLYRILPLYRLEEMIKNHQNVLVRPSSWDDPFETMYSKSSVTIGGVEHQLDASHWFGQCWSATEESSLMWQSFAPLAKKRSFCKDVDDCELKKGVRYAKIKVKTFNLIRSLQNTDNRKLRIGVVDWIRYFQENRAEFEKTINEVKQFHGWLPDMVVRGVSYQELYPLYPLLTKRDAFRHEDEVRLLIFDLSSSPEQTTLPYDFDPSDIDEIILDPWTPDEEAGIIEKKLRKILSDDKVVIQKSKLYNDNYKYSIQVAIN